LSEKKKVSCIHCGATNNYPVDVLDKTVVCGRCKTVLPKPGTVLEPSPEQAARFLRSARLPLLIDFYSPTCAPCHMMHPIVESLSMRRAGELMVMKVNVENNQEMAADFGIMGVPTFIILSNGNERDRTSGAMSEADFSLWVASKV